MKVHILERSGIESYEPVIIHNMIANLAVIVNLKNSGGVWNRV